jgi:hypothetical protein
VWLAFLGVILLATSSLKGNDFYVGDAKKLAHYKPGDLMKIRGLGMKSVAIIAEALESMGIVRDAEEWLR